MIARSYQPGQDLPDLDRVTINRITTLPDLHIENAATIIYPTLNVEQTTTFRIRNIGEVSSNSCNASVTRQDKCYQWNITVPSLEPKSAYNFSYHSFLPCLTSCRYSWIPTVLNNFDWIINIDNSNTIEEANEYNNIFVLKVRFSSSGASNQCANYSNPPTMYSSSSDVRFSAFSSSMLSSSIAASSSVSSYQILPSSSSANSVFSSSLSILSSATSTISSVIFSSASVVSSSWHSFYSSGWSSFYSSVFSIADVSNLKGIQLANAIQYES